MKVKLLTIAMAIIAFIPMYAQKNKGNKESDVKTSEENRSITAFDKMEVTGRFVIKLYPSNKPEVRVITAEEYIPYVVTKVEDGKLKVEINNPNEDKNIFEKLKAKINDYIIRQPIEIRIGVTDLKEIISNGINSFETESALTLDNLSISLSEASKAVLKLNINNNLTVSLTGASKMVATGSTAMLRVSANGAASFNASDLSSEDAVVRLAGASRAEIIATESLDADLSSATKLVCTGSPKSIKQNASRGSSISIK